MCVMNVHFIFKFATKQLHSRLALHHQRQCQISFIFFHQTTKDILADFSLGIVSRVFCSFSGVALLLTMLIHLVVK